jgi:ATP synthase protein I
MTDDDGKKAASLERLDQHLAEVKKLVPEASPQKKLPGDAARAAIDFASATAVGTLLGYGFDRWLQTLPWGLLVGLLIGTATGMKLMFADEKRRSRDDSGDDKN